MKRKQFVGYAVRPNRGTPAARIISVACTAPVAASRGTTRKPSGGIAELRSRETCSRSTISAGCTRTVVAWSGTAWKPSGGIGLPPSKGTPTLKKLWTVCAEDDAKRKGADVRDVSIWRASGRRGIESYNGAFC